MKKLNKVAVLFATAAMAGAAVAAPTTIKGDNWGNNHGNLVWKNGSGELCWQDNNWTPATAASPECGAPVAAPVARPAAPAAAPVSSKITYSADAFFDFDKAVLKPAGRASLDDLVAKLRGLNIEAIVSTGHTDSVGSDAYNQRLGMRRAVAVKNYLVSKGIAADRVYAESKGESSPVATNKTAAGRAQNRRVEIEVVGTR